MIIPNISYLKQELYVQLKQPLFIKMLFYKSITPAKIKLELFLIIYFLWH